MTVSPAADADVGQDSVPVETSPLLDLLSGFIVELRNAGLPVSLTENLDAMEAIRHVPLEDRTALKYALAATLVKNNSHWKAFEIVFDVYFSMVAIPLEKVRQQVRRPAPRVKRQPLQTLEILPVQPQEASPPSSRPGSRPGKARVEAKAKAEQQVAAPAENSEKGDGSGGARTASGALEGNPYRWVVSCVLLAFQAVGAVFERGFGVVRAYNRVLAYASASLCAA